MEKRFLGSNLRLSVVTTPRSLSEARQSRLGPVNNYAALQINRQHCSSNQLILPCPETHNAEKAKEWELHEPTFL